MAEPIWVELKETLIYHELQLDEHGGASGVRDSGLLESALAKPKNLFVYSDQPATLARMAASYAVGIIHNHPFVDGNKRTGLVVSFTFLKLNGIAVTAPLEERYLTILAVAEGEMTEEDLAAWLDKHSSPI